MNPFRLSSALRLSFFLMLITSFTTAVAYDFESGGIYYNITSPNTVEVTYRDTNYNSYSGIIEIPNTVSYNRTTYTVTAIGDYAFYYCNGVVAVTIPESVTSVGEAAFFYCYQLVSVTFLSIIPPTVHESSFDYHLYGYEKTVWEGEKKKVKQNLDCSLVSYNLYVPLESYAAYKKLNDEYHFFNFVVYIGADKTAKPTVLPLANYSEVYASEGQLHTCRVVFYNGPQGLEFIWGTYWDGEEYIGPSAPYAFHSIVYYAYVYAIEEGKEPSEIIEVYEGYYNRYGYTEYNYDIEEQELCFNMENMYSKWVLTSKTVTEYYRDWEVEESEVFLSDQTTDYYKGDIIIPSSITYGNVVGISYTAFKNCQDLTSVYIPYSISAIAQGAFTGCPNINCLKVEDGNTTFDSRDYCNAIIETANNKLIIGCNNTIIPSTVICIGDSAFAGSGITKLSIPNTITSIGRGAFWQCNSLSTLLLTGEGEWSGGALDVVVQRLDIASGITTIHGMQVNPREVYCYSKVPPTCDENTFTDYTGTLHVPESSLAAYFTAPYWCIFANIVGDAVELQSISINKDNAELLIGEQINLNATLHPANANAEAIQWKSSNPSIATVTSDGVVTAMALGECDIIATCLDKRDTCHVKVVEQIVTISLDQHHASILPNHILTLTPTVSPASTPLVVTSSNPAVAAARLVNGVVQVVGITAGTAVIKVASADDNAFADSCLVNVYTEVGDVDGDGFVKIDDVTTIIDYLLGGSASNFNAANADVDFDGEIGISDVTELIDHLLSGGTWQNERFMVNGVPFTMVRVAAGSFMMGATEEQGDDASSWEKPVHQVTLSSYMIGQTEVTQELWQAVMGTNPSLHSGSLQKPVENVSWDDCQAFITQLNALTGQHFRMPTEAEWEYAARGGNKSLGYKYAGSNNIDEVGWVTGTTTHPVGELQPNELGLYDMSGNVDEWVWDYFGYYTSEPQTDPTGPETGDNRMYRGGSWYGGAKASRVSYRFFRAPTFKRGTMGLRLVL